MPRMAGRGIMLEFWEDCLAKLDQQTFPLESEEAKKAAIQAVQRTLRYYLREKGEETVIRILEYDHWATDER